MPKKLSDEQVRQKLIEGRNYKRLYFELKNTFDEVKAENRQLKAENAELKQYFSGIIETQAARITELETMVFGRKKRPRSGGGNKSPKEPRGAASYRRETPADDSVTSDEYYAISACRHCGGPLTDIQEYTRYIEDIILAALSHDAQFKTVVRQTIERGWCVSCGKHSSAKDLRGQTVTLGPQVRSLICHLITLQDHSYEQVINLLRDLYHFKLTDGEIVTILDDNRLKLLPEYEKLKASIRGDPAVHMDESPWPIQSEQGAGYAWSMSSVSNADVVFSLAGSRGKGNGQALLGKGYQGIGITDRYSVYKNLFTTHQICWAHLQRTAKDLTHLECLSKPKQKHVTSFYQGLATIYATIRTTQAEPFNEITRQSQAKTLLLQTKQLCQPSHLDPKKLGSLKAGILEYQDSLFVCLTVDGIPASNNRAERDIRKLVMKRKKSLGCKTTKGARTLEVLLSICWSLYNRDRDNYFQKFHTLATQG